MRKIIVRATFASILMLGSGYAFAVQKQALICNNCSPLSMKQKAATVAAPFEKKVYVADINNSNYQIFHVETIDEGNFHAILTIPITASAAENEMFEAAFELHENIQAASNSGVNIEQLPGVGSSYPGSALEVIGNSALTGQIALGLSNYLYSQNSVSSGLLAVFGDITESDIGKVFKINFADGSHMTFKIMGVNFNSNNEPVVDLDLKPDSTFDPEGRRVPDNVSDLAGMSFDTADFDVASGWTDMLLRSLVEVNSQGVGGGPSRPWVIHCYYTAPNKIKCDIVVLTE